MKNKVIVKHLFIALFVIMLCMPCLIWPLVAKTLDRDSYENRQMQTRPAFHLSTFATYPAACEAWFNDTLPFRNTLIRLNSRLDYYVFRKATSDKVIIGKDGWLFYRDTQDGDPVGCYKGTNLFSEEELEAFCAHLTLMDAALSDQGIEFILFIAPNKERVYAEQMPDYYGNPAEEYRALQLVEYLKAHTDLRVVYPYEALMETKKACPDLPLYHKTDTHWNLAGGYVGSAALLEELGISLPALWNLPVEEVENQSSDLADMLNLTADLRNTESDYQISGYDTHGMVNDKWEFLTEFIYHSTNADPRKLFVCRDSYCTAMSDVLGSQFNNSYMIYRETYTAGLLAEQAPDIFVLEVVERYLGDLQGFDLNRQPAS